MDDDSSPYMSQEKYDAACDAADLKRKALKEDPPEYVDRCGLCFRDLGPGEKCLPCAEMYITHAEWLKRQEVEQAEADRQHTAMLEAFVRERGSR